MHGRIKMKFKSISPIGKKAHSTSTFSITEAQVVTFENSEAVFTAETAGASEADCLTKEVDMAVSTVSNPVVDDDQPLSTWIGGTHSSATFRNTFTMCMSILLDAVQNTSM